MEKKHGSPEVRALLFMKNMMLSEDTDADARSIKGCRDPCVDSCKLWYIRMSDTAQEQEHKSENSKEGGKSLF